MVFDIHIHSEMITRVKLLREGGPLPGPETRLLSNTQKWIVWEDTCADKARGFIGKGHPGGEQQGKGTHENCFAKQLAIWGIMVMGLVSGLSLANHSDSDDSESFLVVHTLLSQDRCQLEGFWEEVGHVVSPFDLSQALLVGGGSLLPRSLPGPPAVKQLMQMVTRVPARVGGFSQRASPNKVNRQIISQNHFLFTASRPPPPQPWFPPMSIKF